MSEVKNCTVCGWHYYWKNEYVHGTCSVACARVRQVEEEMKVEMKKGGNNRVL